MRQIKCGYNAIPPLLLILAVAAPPAYGQGGNPASCRRMLDYSQSFYERAEGPPGEWGLAVDTERSETPVVFSGFGSFGGRRPGREKGLVVTCAAFRNNSGRVVSGIKLSWVITTLEDRNTALLRGDVPIFDVRLDVGEEREVDLDDIFFSEVSRPLTKGGVLEGRYAWVFRVSGVRYEDRGQWEEPAI